MISLFFDINAWKGLCLSHFFCLLLSVENIKLIFGLLFLIAVNFPRRDYQFSITQMALFSNTLVVLPTGLGKTLIAAVVMYNYFRWFPNGKVTCTMLLHQLFIIRVLILDS